MMGCLCGLAQERSVSVLVFSLQEEQMKEMQWSRRQSTYSSGSQSFPKEYKGALPARF